MKKLAISYILCKDCGNCCFDCEYLDTEIGCTNHEFRLSTKCAYFPLIYGMPLKMGYRDDSPIETNSFDSSNKNTWFIYEYPECLIQQNEILMNNLRWVLADINCGKKISFFTVQFEEQHLTLECQQ